MNQNRKKVDNYGRKDDSLRLKIIFVSIDERVKVERMD